MKPIPKKKIFFNGVRKLKVPTTNKFNEIKEFLILKLFYVKDIIIKYGQILPEDFCLINDK